MGRKQVNKAAKSSRSSRLATVIFIPWAALILYALNDWRSDIVRAQRAQTTPGTILAIEKQNHQQRDYTYNVGAISYKGSCVLCAENEGPGAQVVVRYDPLDPSLSTLNDFATDGARPVPLLLCLAGAFITYFGLRRFLLHYTEYDEE